MGEEITKTTDTDLIACLADDYGFSISNLEMFNNDSNKYTKIPKEKACTINSTFQQMPFLAKQAVDSKTMSGLYRVSFDKGLGVLQRSSTPGYLTGNVVKPGTNNKIVEVAKWQEFNPGTALQAANVAMTVFTVASIATGQYFMAQINTHLQEIDQKLDAIMDFLVEDKLSDLWADAHYIENILKNHQLIQNNPYDLNSTLSTIQQIRLRALSNIRFYHTRMDSHISSSTPKDKANIVEQKAHDFVRDYCAYYASMKLYSLSYLAYIVLSGNSSEEYIEIAKADIKEVSSTFNTDYNEQWNNLLVNNKNLNIDDQKYRLITTGIQGTMHRVAGPIGGTIIGLAAEASSSVIKRYDKEKKEKSKLGISSILDEGLNNQPYTDPVLDYLDSWKNISNNKVEIIIDHDEAYLKIDGEKERIDNNQSAEADSQIKTDISSLHDSDYIEAITKKYPDLYKKPL